ncbi:hypothetical protein GCM10010918_45320 [Paenibacillus radicis (ex Gao et al. 2016)]|uniref:Uncharacterized protein n=2 Tax=Paenibacillus radicis (ex Gao et al. 2016) TaxID=1737354 RepID=A0A917M6W6_9BACL|nr:hypothetical protein GCM10010918_45320 [Paenibacillus radicis (ex Gao et al. 2016)]
MQNSYTSFFTIQSNGINEMSYEDPACVALIHIADFRDPVWWAAITKVISKSENENSIVKPTLEQKREIYKRICAHKMLDSMNGIFTSEFDFIEVSINDIDYKKSILDL